MQIASSISVLLLCNTYFIPMLRPLCLFFGITPLPSTNLSLLHFNLFMVSLGFSPPYGKIFLPCQLRFYRVKGELSKLYVLHLISVKLCDTSFILFNSRLQCSPVIPYFSGSNSIMFFITGISSTISSHSLSQLWLFQLTCFC